MSPPDISQTSMIDLFRIETGDQAQTLTAGLLALEREPTAAEHLESCMRAAHSLKGAARIVGIDAGVKVAHAMEDCFVAAQEGRLTLHQGHIDQLLRGMDLIQQIAQTAEQDLGVWAAEKSAQLQSFIDDLTGVPATAPQASQPAEVNPPTVRIELDNDKSAAGRDGQGMLRVTTENLNRLLGLAGESLVESRWLKPFADSLLRLKRAHYELGLTLDRLRENLSDRQLDEGAQSALSETQRRGMECQRLLSQRLVEIETFDRRIANLSHRLYEGALACRMRPFADGARGWPRMVRDLARSLGKQVRFEVLGGDTQVDRDVLEKLEAPLGHLMRNALDHGLELPHERRALDKPTEGLLRVEARHSAGRLQVSVCDDGRGIDLDRLRAAIVKRNLSTTETVARMSEAELLDFLFLPGFSMKETVTEVSGRGVGLDVVHEMLKQVRGTVRVIAQPGKGARFQLELPLTLSVMRTLLVEVGGEAYAIPLAYISRTLKLPKDSVDLLEGRAHFNLNGVHIGLVTAQQVLGGTAAKIGAEIAIIVIGDLNHSYGLVVDRFLGERELVVQTLDARLGKIKDVAAGALMEDGSPVLILDVEDLIRSVEKLVAAGRLSGVTGDGAAQGAERRKRVLVVEDSFTVRELERKLLANSGYEVEVAVDGMDGWNAVRTGNFDLAITDIDMPRMDGIELVRLVKKDPNLKSLPMMIVSYKDRPEDRQRGLDAGADYYLTKGSFHDETLLRAVVDLIGEASA